jgi:hypothetical protein
VANDGHATAVACIGLVLRIYDDSTAQRYCRAS